METVSTLLADAVGGYDTEVCTVVALGTTIFFFDLFLFPPPCKVRSAKA